MKSNAVAIPLLAEGVKEIEHQRHELGPREDLENGVECGARVEEAVLAAHPIEELEARQHVLLLLVAVAEHLQHEGLREAEVQMRKGQVGGVPRLGVKRRVVFVVVVSGGFEDLEDLGEEVVVSGLEPFFEGEDYVLCWDQARCRRRGGGGEWN